MTVALAGGFLSAVPPGKSRKKSGKKLSCKRRISHGASISANSQRGRCLI